MSELIKYSEQTFESIKHINKYVEEYWLACKLIWLTRKRIKFC